jgi:glutathione synthase/RimK-type ligase-like ATP-grasp enzyme
MFNASALDAAIQKQSTAFQASLTDMHAHLFSAATVTISRAQLEQMQAVIAAAEAVLGEHEAKAPLGVFYGYDFHLNADGAHLIEINSNAGGAFLNALLIESQPNSEETLLPTFVAMFRHEWQLARGDASLKCIAIVDQQPTSQYLYPEFLLAQQAFEQAGIACVIADPLELTATASGLTVAGQTVDLIYNRLTDFDLKQHSHLLNAWQNNQLVLTPNPAHYQRYADKRKLTQLTDEDWLKNAGISAAQIEVLRCGIPETKIVLASDAEKWWAERKQWFFKPVSGYGSKGAYRGDKLTKRVFEEILQADYVAQRVAPPGECSVKLDDSTDAQSLKFDVRCYVYAGKIQLIAARLYQGQTTNFRTIGGGFGLVVTDKND